MADEDKESDSMPSSSRRTLTMRSNAARQVAVNFLPSRQLPYNTLRSRRTFSEDNVLLHDEEEAGTERQADQIVKEMEQHQQLMLDDPHAEELRREALRDLPEGLTIKRSVRAKLSVSVSLRSKRRPISFMKRLKYQLSFAWSRTQDRLRDFLFSIELWYEAIRNIEGHFGSAVGSYFRFLRWVFAANVLLSILTICLIVLPQILYDAGKNRTLDVGVMDGLTGKGGLEDTLLFYGHYHHGDISPSGLTYNMPFAYFFTIVCLYLVTFAVLCYKTAYSYRRNFIFADGVSHALSHKLFCGWDFSIVSEHAAKLHATSIYNELKELLNEQTKKTKPSNSIIQTLQYLANIVVTAIVIGLIIGMQYGLWRLLGLETNLRYWELCVSFIVTVVLTFFPVLFSFIVRLEYYTPRTALYVTLARTWALDIGTMILLLMYWTQTGHECWESHNGQESYRLIVLDSVVSLFLLPALEFFRGYFYKLNKQSSTPPEFNIAYNSLTIIYNQSVLWLGTVHCPLLPVLVAAKLLLLFYVKRECALRACQPARKVWRAAQTQTMLYLLVTLSLFAAMLAIGTLFLGTSSKCGPFRQYEFVYSVFTEGVLHLSERATVARVIAVATKPGVIALLALILGVSVYYTRARALAQRSMVDILRQMLVLQAKDKDFLLTAIAKVSNGEWMYSPKPEHETGPHSQTWKYLQEVRKPSNADYNFDASRLTHSYIERPKSYLKDNRPNSYHPEMSKSNEDGDTDSSFSWQGSTNYLNKKSDETGGKM